MTTASIRTAHPIYEDVLALLTAAGFVSLGMLSVSSGWPALWRYCRAGAAAAKGDRYQLRPADLKHQPALLCARALALRMGPRFTFNTFVSVAAVSYMTDHLNGVLQIGKDKASMRR